ncbi:hypothetical protein C8J57DRAFT_1251883 [Mycena rebaudengoi]|nr:hypothetical protein C8J57DRAFT_1251883 [Mycena rebaudengoi]
MNTAHVHVGGLPVMSRAACRAWRAMVMASSTRRRWIHRYNAYANDRRAAMSSRAHKFHAHVDGLSKMHGTSGNQREAHPTATVPGEVVWWSWRLAQVIQLYPSTCNNRCIEMGSRNPPSSPIHRAAGGRSRWKERDGGLLEVAMVITVPIWQFDGGKFPAFSSSAHVKQCQSELQPAGHHSLPRHTHDPGRPRTPGCPAPAGSSTSCGPRSRPRPRPRRPLKIRPERRRRFLAISSTATLSGALLLRAPPCPPFCLPVDVRCLELYWRGRRGVGSTAARYTLFRGTCSGSSWRPASGNCTLGHRNSEMCSGAHEVACDERVQGDGVGVDRYVLADVPIGM